jgi:hypothetical protein
MSYGKFSLVTQPNTFFNGTQTNDFCLHHTNSNNSLVIGVDTSAIFISSSNVHVHQTLVSHSLLSPVKGTIMTSVNASSVLPCTLDPVCTYTFIAIGQGVAYSALVCNATFTSPMTTDTATSSSIVNGQLVLTNNTATDQTYTWSLVRVL